MLHQTEPAAYGMLGFARPCSQNTGANAKHLSDGLIKDEDSGPAQGPDTQPQHADPQAGQRQT